MARKSDSDAIVALAQPVFEGAVTKIHPVLGGTLTILRHVAKSKVSRETKSNAEGLYGFLALIAVGVLADRYL